MTIVQHLEAAQGDLGTRICCRCHVHLAVGNVFVGIPREYTCVMQYTEASQTIVEEC